VFVDDTTAQLQAVAATVEDVRTTVTTDLSATKESLGAELVSIQASLSAEIANLAAMVDRSLRSPSVAVAGGSTSATASGADGGTAGPDGRHWEQHHRGNACAQHMSSPVGGNSSDRHKFSSPHSDSPVMSNTDSDSNGPCVDLPQFDGANPKLWQHRSEEYFTRWRTPAHLWVSYASSLFIHNAATWLEAYLHQNPWPPWSEFVAVVMTRFGRNQHQILVLRLFHIS
jgi:hypothetical protein